MLLLHLLDVEVFDDLLEVEEAEEEDEVAGLFLDDFENFLARFLAVEAVVVFEVDEGADVLELRLFYV